jgi:hypothetical protein
MSPLDWMVVPRPELERPRGRMETELRRARLPSLIWGHPWQELPWRLPRLRPVMILPVTLVVCAGVWGVLTLAATTEPGSLLREAFAWIAVGVCGFTAATYRVPWPSTRKLTGAAMTCLWVSFGWFAALTFRYAGPEAGPDATLGNFGLVELLQPVVAVVVSTLLLLGNVPQLLGSMLRGVQADARDALRVAAANALTPLLLVMIVPLAKDPWRIAAGLDGRRAFCCSA